MILSSEDPKPRVSWNAKQLIDMKPLKAITYWAPSTLPKTGTVSFVQSKQRANRGTTEVVVLDLENLSFAKRYKGPRENSAHTCPICEREKFHGRG
jgi:hypothetical protein